MPDDARHVGSVNVIVGRASAMPHESGFPAVTLALASAVLLVALVPALQRALVLDRDMVAAGQLWRVVTGNLVHFSASHLFFDLFTVVTAAAILERGGTRLGPVIAIAAAAIGLAVMVFAPELRRYGGLSGIAYTLVVLCALQQLRTSGLTRVVALVILVATVVKLGWELRSGGLLIVEASAVPFIPVPVAHLAGAAVGLAAFLWPPGGIMRFRSRWVAITLAAVALSLAAACAGPRRDAISMTTHLSPVSTTHVGAGTVTPVREVASIDEQSNPADPGERTYHRGAVGDQTPAPTLIAFLAMLAAVLVLGRRW